jgi:POT family proton-dependent oligopeptide transporter
MIGQLIPDKLQGIMMGSWMMTIGVAATISNIFSKIAIGNTESIDPIVTNPFFTETFNILGWGSILGGIILIILIPFLHKLIKEKKHHEESSAIPL